MGRTVVALVAAAAVLLAAWWFDTEVMRAIQQAEGATFDVTQTAIALPLGYLMISAGILVIALLARWAESLLVNLAYTLSGGFFAFLFTFVWLLAAGKNGVPPILPEPLASFLGHAWTTTESGPLNAVAIIGAGMFLVGVTSLVLGLGRRASRASTAPMSADGTTPSPVVAPEVRG